MKTNQLLLLSISIALFALSCNPQNPPTEYHNEGLGESKWPYDKPFYLILNVAVGGEWGRIKGIDEKNFPQTMEVDYVRVFQKKQDNSNE